MYDGPIQSLNLETVETWQMSQADSYSVRVIFKKKLSRSELLQSISNLQNPQAILWYIGEYGFREEGVNFYRKDLRKLLSLDNQTCCFFMI